MSILYLMFTPPNAGIVFSDYKGKKSVAEGGYKSNKYLYHTMHVKIPEYQVQNMIIDQLKDKHRKIKTSVWYKRLLMK